MPSSCGRGVSACDKGAPSREGRGDTRCDTLYIGAKTLRGDIASYGKRFDLLEVMSGETGAGVPSMATLRRWRKAVPPHFAFTVIGSPGLASLRPGEALERGRADAKASADVLQARCVFSRRRRA